MKFVILALLVGSLIAVSPSALGQHYDDTLHNNLSIEMRNTETEAEQFSTNPVIVGLAKSQILRLAAENMTAEDFKSASSIVRQVIDEAKAGESHHTFHAFFAAMDYENEQARTYELTLVRKETSIVGILTKKTHEVAAQKKYSFYFETYNSPFGLPFTYTQKGPIFDKELTNDLVIYMRQYLLRAAEQTRGSSMHMEGNLQGFAE